MSSSEAEAVSLDPTTAKIAGRFVVETQLGRGGMGSIYRVLDERTGRKLALKRLRANKGDARNLLATQFEREYHTLVQLAHPRIIEVFDYGVEDGEPYYTMELLDGEDLFQRGKLEWRPACAVLRDVASSLAILHSRRLLHRDISARNVRLTADGRAKLIDFGAMTPMGPVKHVVGTPPFVPPEALQRQALDGRSDLYALGGLAYWVLTGRYAYPARNLEQLRELWQSPPPSPLQCGIELPEALNQLVMEMLQLEREARPSSAAEVMERLSGIAGLALSELPEVGKAYLSTPTLVGRDASLKEVRANLSAAVQGRGSTTLIEGDEGTGRTRFLDACILEAKLLGATVLHADSSDGGGAELGIARELSAQLLEALPELAQKSARLWRAQLSALLPELASGAPTPPAAAAPQDARKLQSALRNWFLLIARRRQLVIAVDDVDAIDDSSANWLSSLSIAARRRRLSLVLTHRSSRRHSARITAMNESAKVVTLGNLDLAESQALLHSVFGDVDHVAGIAARIHGLSEGNPRWTMLLAQTLVERGLARYEAGSWALPAQLSSSDLPQSLTAALATRIDTLSADAQALAEVLSLTEPQLLPPDTHAELLPDATPARVVAALHALVEAGVLVREGTGYRFTQQEVCELLRNRSPEERRRALHARIAQAANRTGDAVLIARHLLQSGQEQRAIERLLPLRNDESLSFSTRMLEVLELAVAASQRSNNFHRLIRNELEEWLIAQGAVLGRLSVFKRYGEALLERMQRDCGLTDYLASDPKMPPDARLRQAVDAARARYEALPESERGLNPEDAARRLGRICSIVTGMAAVANDISLIERLPALEPLFPICPMLRVAHIHVQQQVHMQAGRFDQVQRVTTELLGMLERREYAIDPLYGGELRKAALYVMGLLSTTSAAVGASDWLTGLEQIPGYRVLAWRLRMAGEVALGRVEAAAECRKRAEVLLLQDAGKLPYPGTTAAIELLVHAAADDVVGTKRAMERIVPLAEAFPGWAPQLALARAHYLRIRGDDAGALAVLEPALDKAPACRHSQWGNMTELRVILLSKVGRHEEALARAAEYADAAARLHLRSAMLGMLRAHAEALIAAGRPLDALPLIEENLRVHALVGTRGLFLGRSLETRARVAIALKDEAGLREYAERCAREYKGGRNLALSAKYERLMREADSAGMSITTGVRRAAEVLGSGLLAGDSVVLTGSSRLLACVSSVERVQEGLRLLLESSGAETGFVFALVNHKLELRATLDDLEPEAAMLETMNAYIRHQLDDQEERTTFDSIAEVSAPQAGYTDAGGRYFEPVLLYGRRDNQKVIAGLAVLHYTVGQRTVMRRELLDAVGTALLQGETVS